MHFLSSRSLASPCFPSPLSPELPGAPSNLVISNISPRSAILQFRPGYDGKTSICRWIVEGQVCACGSGQLALQRAVWGPRMAAGECRTAGQQHGDSRDGAGEGAVFGGQETGDNRLGGQGVGGYTREGRGLRSAGAIEGVVINVRVQVLAPNRYLSWIARSIYFFSIPCHS